MRPPPIGFLLPETTRPLVHESAWTKTWLRWQINYRFSGTADDSSLLAGHLNLAYLITGTGCSSAHRTGTSTNAGRSAEPSLERPERGVVRPSAVQHLA
jgi:hypothetical protein